VAAHKWLARLLADGANGLWDKSSRPEKSLARHRTTCRSGHRRV